MILKRLRPLIVLFALPVWWMAGAPAAELGVHFDTYSSPETPIDAAGAYRIIKDMGGEVVRRNIYWDALQVQQEQPVAAFDARSATFDGPAYEAYLAARGYGAAGENLQEPFQELVVARQLGLKELFNLNVIPAWAKRYPNAQYPDPRAFFLADNAAVGQFLFDFIVFVARQKNGRDVLRHVAGFEIFNEIDGWVQQYNPGYGPNTEHQLPVREYLEILRHCIVLTGEAFDAVGMTRAEDRPPVIGPNTTADYQPRLWQSYLRDQASTRSRVQSTIGLHPYGVTLRPWVNMAKIDAGKQVFEVPEAWEQTRNNLSYGRILQPTDDLAWWRAVVGRNRRNSAAWGLYSYDSRGVPADMQFNRNAELGVERTLAQFHLAGRPVPRVFFSEFGASLYRGTGEEDGLMQTPFVDPYRFGFHGPGMPLPKGVALNLAMESLLQSLGLIESWDFVEAATVYDLFAGGKDGYLEEFGLAGSRLRGGRAQLNMQGEMFRDYLQGRAIHLTRLSGADPAASVDLFVDAVAGQGSFQPKGRRAVAHETVLLRDGADIFDAGEGDDIVFGGGGHDEISGGAGYDKIYGGSGNDVLQGGAGADRIKGDAGDDVMSGGEGVDTFIFSAYGQTGSGFGGHDVIEDFDPATDRIVLVGGYAAASLVTQAGRIIQRPDGALITYARNGASVLLRGVKAAAVKAEGFDVLTADDAD